MRFAFSLRRRACLMQLDPSKSGSLRSSSVSSHLSHKRPYAQAATSHDQGESTSSSEQLFQPPPKFPKLDSSPKVSRTRSRQMEKSNMRHVTNQPARAGSAPSQSSRNRSKAFKAKSQPKAAVLPGPLHDAEFIVSNHKSKPLKEEWEVNPKSPLMNLIVNTLKEEKPIFEFSQGLLDGKILFRSAFLSTINTRCKDSNLM